MKSRICSTRPCASYRSIRSWSRLPSTSDWNSSRQQHVGKGFRIAPDTTDLFKRAMERARTQGRKTIEATDIFEALTNYDSLFVDVLRTMGANPEAVAENVRAQVQKREQEEEQYRKKFELPPYLKHFGVSLNRLARADKIPPTIGREKEIQQMIEILCHRERANSPMLVGEPGVGKTAVIEGLARTDRIGTGKSSGAPARFAHRAAADGRPRRRHDAARHVRRTNQGHHRRSQENATI